MFNVMVTISTVDLPSIIEHPKSQQVTCGDKNVSLTISAKGRYLMYQWKKVNKDGEQELKNDQLFQGVNSTELVIKTISNESCGKYVCVVKNDSGLSDSVQSNPASITLIKSKYTLAIQLSLIRFRSYL